jgi:hypothetical protein
LGIAVVLAAGFVAWFAAFGQPQTLVMMIDGLHGPDMPVIELSESGLQVSIPVAAEPGAGGGRVALVKDHLLRRLVVGILRTDAKR